MNSFCITTDNTADLPYSFYKEHNIHFMYLPYVMEGRRYTWKDELPVEKFYACMRAGQMPTTSQYNAEEVKTFWKPLLDEGKDILHIAFSSGLSGSYNSARIAAGDMEKKYPDRRIVVIDSLCASLGEGLLVWHAVKRREEGASLEEVSAWLRENRLHLCHVFTVDDLNHLYRGGRVSKAAAVFGTMVNIKPLLHVDNEGHLIPLSKVRGRKRSLLKLVDMMEERLGGYRDKNPMIMISHGDCLEEAEFVRDKVKERFGYDTFLINHVGATIGAHSGPGTMALFFLGEHR